VVRIHAVSHTFFCPVLRASHRKITGCSPAGQTSRWLGSCKGAIHAAADNNWRNNRFGSELSWFYAPVSRRLRARLVSRICPICSTAGSTGTFGSKPKHTAQGSAFDELTSESSCCPFEQYWASDAQPRRAGSRSVQRQTQNTAPNQASSLVEPFEGPVRSHQVPNIECASSLEAN